MRLLETINELNQTHHFFDGTLTSIEDFKTVPLTEKKHLERGEPKETPHVWACTSGTTGSHVLIPLSKQAYEKKVQRMLEVFQNTQCPKGPMLNAVSFHVHNTGISTHDAAIRYGITSIPIGDNLNALHNVLEKTNPSSLFTYACNLPDYLPTCKITHAYVTGMLLSNVFRKKFPETKIFNIYGISEVGVIAAQINEQGPMILHTQGLYLEVLHEDGSVSNKGEGELIVTDLYNTSAPIIRFRTNDKVRIKDNSIEVIGRFGDFINVGGTLMHKENLIDVVRQATNSTPFLIVLNEDIRKCKSKLVIYIKEQTHTQKVLDVIGELGETAQVRVSEIAQKRTSSGKVINFLRRSKP